MRRLTETAERVSKTGDLSERIEVSGKDELTSLAESFNSMLAALEDSTRAQRQLVADASHELRTPLTSLRTNIEVLASDRAFPRRTPAAALGRGRAARRDDLAHRRADRARPRGAAHRRARERSARCRCRGGARAGPPQPSGDPVRVRRSTSPPCTASRRRSSARSATSSTTRRSGLRQAVRSSSRSQTASSRSATMGRASRRRTFPTCSTASTAPALPAGCPDRDSGSRSCARSRKPTAATSPPSRPRAAGLAWCSV